MADPAAEEPVSDPPPLVAGAGRLFRFRWILLTAYLLGMGGCYTFFRTVPEPIGFPMPWEVLGLGTAVLVVLQLAFLSGMPELRWPRPTRRRPMALSISAGALVAALLSCGILGTIISFGRFDRAFEDWVQRMNGNSFRLLDIPWPLFAILGVNWLIWLAVFAVVCAGQWTVKFRWIYRTLVAGTWLELLVTIPVDIEVRKRTKCYCGEGTFFAMAVGITMAFWTFGPGLVALFLTRRMQRRSVEPLCFNCGYNLHGLAEPRCPECGKPFSRRRLSMPRL